MHKRVLCNELSKIKYMDVRVNEKVSCYYGYISTNYPYSRSLNGLLQKLFSCRIYCMREKNAEKRREMSCVDDIKNGKRSLIKKKVRNGC